MAEAVADGCHQNGGGNGKKPLQELHIRVSHIVDKQHKGRVAEQKFLGTGTVGEDIRYRRAECFFKAADFVDVAATDDIIHTDGADNSGKEHPVDLDIGTKKCFQI